MGGEVDTVVVVTDAEDGRGGLSGRMDEEDMAFFFVLVTKERLVSAVYMCSMRKAIVKAPFKLKINQDKRKG